MSAGLPAQQLHGNLQGAYLASESGAQIPVKHISFITHYNSSTLLYLIVLSLVHMIMSLSWKEGRKEGRRERRKEGGKGGRGEGGILLQRVKDPSPQ